MESSSAKTQSGISKGDNEIEHHFKLRKSVYDSAVAKGVPGERAVVLASIFKNNYFMGCEYPEEVMKESRKYWPKEALDRPLYQPLSS